MSKCVYCGHAYEIDRGLTLVLKDGLIKHFCSSKCRKNYSRGRRKIPKWIIKKKESKKELRKEILEETKEEHQTTVSKQTKSE
ncbi:MAG: 50S ribosomal protein L24 [bacterium]